MRLIDADKLEKEMNELCGGECDNCCLSNCPVYSQPTAYDVNKVVAELIEEANNTIVDFKKDKYIYTSKAIEIVRAGGVN